MASAARRCGDGEVRAAATGAIEKPNNDVRPPHGVNLSTKIVIQDRPDFPGPEELVETTRVDQASIEVCFSV